MRYRLATPILAMLVMTGCMQQAGPRLGATPAALTARVSVHDFTFDPMTLVVQAGTTVTWTNADPIAQSVSSKLTGDDAFHGELSMPGSSYSHRFDHAGTFTYSCDEHPAMVGTVIVNEPVVATQPSVAMEPTVGTQPSVATQP